MNITQKRMLVQNNLRSLPYKDKQRIEQSCMQLLGQIHTLQPKVEAYVFNNGAQQRLFKLDGTIPINYQGKQYNIPVSIWIPTEFPARPPMVYVTPVSGMRIKDRHRHVDPQGFVYHPYLHSWQATSSLVDLVGLLCSTFGADPPVFSGGASRPAAQPSGGYRGGGRGGGGGRGYAGPAPGRGYGRGAPAPYGARPGAGPAPSGYGGPPVGGYGAYGMGRGAGPAPTGYTGPGARPAPTGYAGPGARPAPTGYTGPGGYAQPPPPQSQPQPQPQAAPRGSGFGGMMSGAMGAFGGAMGRSGPSVAEQNEALKRKVDGKLRAELQTIYDRENGEMNKYNEQQVRLQENRSKIDEMERALRTENEQLSRQREALVTKMSEMEAWLRENEGRDEVNVDSCIAPTDTWAQQCLNACAQDAALSDVMRELDRALMDEQLRLPVYLRETRKLARAQFEHRALSQEILKKQQRHIGPAAGPGPGGGRGRGRGGGPQGGPYFAQYQQAR